ncbi:MAG: flavin reductase family protein [Candidatus Bathyarchaeota archaeon]|nr:flavin reductase family protein [Candidatus Bathyarchaeota archaeon]MDH5494913.1 flavin reductase family protein [Candidatus Bathyarchaeota archaeon]
MGKKKIETPLSNAYRFLHPMHTVLVTCAEKAGKANIITLAWAMPTSINPPLVAISIKPSRHSYKLIRETQEFAVNIPTMEIVKETLFCGRRSGKNHDKFKETKLTSLPAKTIKAPIIKECVAYLECKLQQMFVTGDHTIFVGEVIEAYSNEESFKEEFDIEKTKLIYHLGGNKFATLIPKIVEPSL